MRRFNPLPAVRPGDAAWLQEHHIVDVFVLKARKAVFEDVDTYYRSIILWKYLLFHRLRKIANLRNNHHYLWFAQLNYQRVFKINGRNFTKFQYIFL